VDTRWRGVARGSAGRLYDPDFLIEMHARQAHLDVSSADAFPPGEQILAGNRVRIAEEFRRQRFAEQFAGSIG
jgi:hypothetical protein